ncbi:MAG: phospho-sugar mutase [Actinomycetota bacterium]|nr:phospho-sugar mutase [Actinomycetota bacterium]
MGTDVPDRLTPALRDEAMRWIADDPSSSDRAELQQVLADAMGGNASALADLTDRMSAPLAFGTAGLRGPLRAGPAGMNLAVVRRAAAGIAAHLLANGGRDRIVVIGHDARHRSAEFAADAAKVLAAAGFRALLAPGALPTPITAFAVRHLDAAAGLQVTASHNPPQDNGLKVYLQAGAQIVAPTDAAIEAAIAAVPAAVSVDTAGTPQPWPTEGPTAIVERYLARAASLAGSLAVTSVVTESVLPAAATESAPPAPASVSAVIPALRIVATAMHGVGAQSLAEVLARAGFTDVHMVASQQQPDPDFPTVAFPNPEEPGATDQLLALAEELDADLAIANDPDADRCAIGAKAADGSWRMLRGDETGSLLGDHLLSSLNRAEHPDPLVATTIVSSSLLRSIAAAHHARYDETLTGFKWIVRAGDGQGTGLVYGYEEALGVCVDPDYVRDKDGISAAVVAADLAATLKAKGRTLFDALDDLARSYGLHVTDQLSVRITDVSEIADAMQRLRSALPVSLLGAPVTGTDDLLPRTDAVVLRTEQLRIVVRPSGTEPKLKFYLEVVIPIDPRATDISAGRASAAEKLGAACTEIAGVLGLSG